MSSTLQASRQPEQLETRIAALETAAKEKHKDRWDKAQVLATFFLGCVGLIFTYMVQNQQEENRKSQVETQEENRKSQLATQIMSQREQSEMSFRGTMFQSILKELLTTGAGIEKRMTVLRLFQENFHDTFNGRALVYFLADEAKRKKQRVILSELIALGRQVSAAQESQVEASVGKKFESFWLNEGESETKSFGFDTGGVHQDSHEMTIKLNRVTETGAEVRIKLPDKDSDDREGKRLEVSYFDTPFGDNKILPDHHRFAVVLKDTDLMHWPHSAKLKVVEFPAHYVVNGYKPSVDRVEEMLQEMKTK